MGMDVFCVREDGGRLGEGERVRGEGEAEGTGWEEREEDMTDVGTASAGNWLGW